MTLNTKYLFCCSEIDYPKFATLFPGILPSSYAEFVARTDKNIHDRDEQITVLKANVGYEEFLTFCEARGEKPSYEALQTCVFHAWGRLPNA